MIHVNKAEVQVKGEVFLLLSELGMITRSMLGALSKCFTEEAAKGMIRDAMELGLKPLEETEEMEEVMKHV